LIRIFWFAAICLSALGGLLAAKVTSSIATAEEGVLDPTMLGIGLAGDTLAKADKLKVAYLLPSRLPSAATNPEPGATASSQRLATSNIDRRSVMLPKPRPKIKLEVRLGVRQAKNSHPAKPAVEVKTCSRPEGLGGLLMSFAGAPRCG
jgi:hypothetical protein